MYSERDEVMEDEAKARQSKVGKYYDSVGKVS